MSLIFCGIWTIRQRKRRRRGSPGYIYTEALFRENRRRREIFTRQLGQLYAEDRENTDWKKITDLYDRMRRETGIRRE